MPETELIDVAAIRKILNIDDTVDDPELEKLGEVWADTLESDLGPYASAFPLTGENKNKAIRCVSLGVASGYKNSRNNKDQATFYMELYEKAKDALISRLQTQPKSARQSVRNEYVTKTLHFQKKRI